MGSDPTGNGIVLRNMQTRVKRRLLFSSSFNPDISRDQSAIRHRITAVIKALNKKAEKEGGDERAYHSTRVAVVFRHAGVPERFDRCRDCNVGDKTGPSIIAATYGDLRPDHLLAQARRIRLSVTANAVEVIPQAIYSG